MTKSAPLKASHLPDLTIEGFFGIEALTIDKLSPVTLITGLNGIGKTTVLDAIRVYAERANPATLMEILRRRNELIDQFDESGNPVSALDWTSLFYGRSVANDSSIVIGPQSNGERSLLRIKLSEDDSEQGEFWNDYSDAEPRSLTAEIGTASRTIRMVQNPDRSFAIRRRWRNELQLSLGSSGIVPCQSLGPGLPDRRATSALWRTIALRDSEEDVVAALNIVAAGSHVIERVTVIESEEHASARPIVRLAGREDPIPLNSLGDGAVRMFGVALSLANCQNGFLLIDEVENGIHHTIQEQFWAMLLQAAHRNNAQVFATTHSWDTVCGYARAATHNDEVDGALVRLERDAEGMFAIEYTERELAAVAQQGIEVR